MLFTSESGGIDPTPEEIARMEAAEAARTSICEYPGEKLQEMMLNSGVTSYYQEAIYVAHIVRRNIRQKNIIPSVVEHKGIGLASRCLISLGFFEAYMQHLTDRHGYPKPDFYVEAGKKAFFDADKKDVSEHFESWTEFLHETFEAKPVIKGVESAVAYEKIRYHKVFPGHSTFRGHGMLSRGYDLGSLEENPEVSNN